MFSQVKTTRSELDAPLFLKKATVLANRLLCRTFPQLKPGLYKATIRRYHYLLKSLRPYGSSLRGALENTLIKLP